MIRRSVTIENRADGSFVVEVSELRPETGYWQEVSEVTVPTLYEAVATVPDAFYRT